MAAAPPLGLISPPLSWGELLDTTSPAQRTTVACPVVAHNLRRSGGD